MNVVVHPAVWDDDTCTGRVILFDADGKPDRSLSFPNHINDTTPCPGCGRLAGPKGPARCVTCAKKGLAAKSIRYDIGDAISMPATWPWYRRAAAWLRGKALPPCRVDWCVTGVGSSDSFVEIERAR